MPTYLYGLLLTRNAHLIPPHITGIGGSGVRLLECDDLAAIVSSLERVPAKVLEDVRAHDHALQSVVHHGATAAAGRFGQTFSDDREARTHVMERGQQIRRALADCDGCVEMRVLVAGAPGQPTPSAPRDAQVGPGRAYLEQLRGEHRSLEHLKLGEALGPLVRAERVEALPNARGVVFSHLIEREREGDYRKALAAIPALAECTVVGPLALYAFASGDRE